MNHQGIIETTDLTKAYGNLIAVDKLNLHIAEGEIYGFLGPNGAGKTTTILMLLGLTEPTSGNAHVCGFNPTREPIQLKRIVGYLPEKVGFYEDLTARLNLEYTSFASQKGGTRANLAQNLASASPTGGIGHRPRLLCQFVDSWGGTGGTGSAFSKTAAGVTRRAN